MPIDEIIPSDAFILQILGIGAIVLLAVLIYGYRLELLAVVHAVFFRYVAAPPDRITETPITPRPDAVNEIPEIVKPAEIDPAELDRMIAERTESIRWEERAAAVGTLEGRGLLVPGTRSRALDALGIRGARYTTLKPRVDAAQAAAQSEAQTAQQSLPSAPPILVNAGRPDERSVDRGTAP